MRLLVLGAGGIGGYFGGRLAQSGADVTFLVRDARAARLQAEGLVIESPLGDARLDVTTATPGMLVGVYDLVLLSCKAYDLDSAIDTIRPAVGPGTSIMPLLNGLAHVERLEAAFGAKPVLGGLAHISVTLLPDGRIRHLNKLSTLTYGARLPEQEAHCAAIEALLAPVNFEWQNSRTVMQDMWEKFVFITAAASMTCLMRAPVGDILQADDGERLILQVLGECGGVASASGFPVRDKAKDWARSALTQQGSPLTASMLRDLQSGAKIEADHLQGDMIRRAGAHDVDVALLRTAYCHLQAYMAGRAGR